jgi:endonuclease/exonuclease/phosphatase (EEP) superfamily protein YafD
MAYGLVTTLTVLLALVTFLPILRIRHWLVRGQDFPRLQYAALALALLLAQLWLFDWSERGSWWPAALATACLLYQAYWIQPYTRLHRKEARSVPRGDGSGTLRIMSVNVLMTNRNAQGLLRIVRQADPDFLITLETDRWWQSRLDELDKDYPYSVKCPLDNLYGMHVYSRYPLLDPAVQYLVEPDIPSVHAALELPDGRRIKMHCLHPKPPSPTENPGSGERDAELIAVAGSIAETESDVPVVVAGDLNDVAWSSTTRLFRKISGLLDPRVGRGMFNTFHTRLPFMRWPLDHLFHSDHFGVVSMRRLPAFGSDHFPILVELALVPGLERHQEGLAPDAEDEERAAETVAAEDVSPEEVHDPKA